MNLENILTFLSNTGIVMFFLVLGYTFKYVISWVKNKILSSKTSLKNAISILSQTTREVNETNKNLFSPEEKKEPQTSEQILNEQIKKGNQLYKALQAYTKEHTYQGTDTLAYHLRYGISRAKSETYLNQLKSLAIESDRCSSLIKEHISQVIKEVNASSVSPDFAKTPNNQAHNSQTNQTKGSSNQNTENQKIPQCSIDPNSLSPDRLYTFIGWDSKDNQNKRWKNQKGSVLRALVESVKNGNYPQDGIYPMYLDNTNTPTTSNTTTFPPYNFTN